MLVVNCSYNCIGVIYPFNYPNLVDDDQISFMQKPKAQKPGMDNPGLSIYAIFLR